MLLVGLGTDAAGAPSACRCCSLLPPAQRCRVQALCTATAFVGDGWDWDVLLVELFMQVSNGAIAACLHFRRQLLRHVRAKQGVVALVLVNSGLRIAVFAMLVEIVLASPNSNDGECKQPAAPGTCGLECSPTVMRCCTAPAEGGGFINCDEWWYIRTQVVQEFAFYSLISMTIDSVLTGPCGLLNLRAILRLEQNWEAFVQVDSERSGVPLMGAVQ